MEIIYRTDIKPSPEQVIALYESAGLHRPTDDPARIAAMYENSNLVVTAWDGEVLVGASRSVTDWVWCAYLADLAVRSDCMKSGVGRRLIELTKETAGERVMIILLSVPSAMEYYPKVGFEKDDRCFSMKRKY